MSCKVANLDGIILVKIRFTARRLLLLGTQGIVVGESADEGGSWYVRTGGVGLLDGLLAVLR